MNPRVRARRKNTRNFPVALDTGFVANENCTWNVRRRLDCSGDGRTGVQHQSGGYKRAEGQDRDCWVLEAQAVGLGF